MLCILREKVKFLLQLNLNLEFLDLCFICFLHVSFSAIITIIKKKSKFVFFLAYEENCVRRKITSHYPRETHS